jgi:hypothetical protein
MEVVNAEDFSFIYKNLTNNNFVVLDLDNAIKLSKDINYNRLHTLDLRVYFQYLLNLNENDLINEINQLKNKE